MSEVAIPMKLDRSRDYGVIYGSAEHRFVQDGYLFDVNGFPLRREGHTVPMEPTIDPPEPTIESAMCFLRQILKEGPLSKAAVYAAAERNNQPWPNVTEAFPRTNIKVFKAKGQEMWKLGE